MTSIAPCVDALSHVCVERRQRLSWCGLQGAGEPPTLPCGEVLFQNHSSGS